MKDWKKYFVKEMVYKPERFKKNVVLAKGVLNGHEFVILNLGTHPCSYVKMPKLSVLNNFDYTKIVGVDCHGGLTFAGKLNNRNGFWFGWDYAHSGDFNGYYLKEPEATLLDDKKWTTEELISEMWSVTYDFKELRKFVNGVLNREVFVT